MAGVTGTGRMSIVNNSNKLRKHFIRADLQLSEGSSGIGVAKLMYRLETNRANQRGLFKTIYIPIKQPGEIGPNPMIANTANTERHLI